MCVYVCAGPLSSCQNSWPHSQSTSPYVYQCSERRERKTSTQKKENKHTHTHTHSEKSGNCCFSLPACSAEVNFVPPWQRDRCPQLRFTLRWREQEGAFSGLHNTTFKDISMCWCTARYGSEVMRPVWEPQGRLLQCRTCCAPQKTLSRTNTLMIRQDIFCSHLLTSLLSVLYVLFSLLWSFRSCFYRDLTVFQKSSQNGWSIVSDVYI